MTTSVTGVEQQERKADDQEHRDEVAILRRQFSSAATYRLTRYRLKRLRSADFIHFDRLYVRGFSVAIGGSPRTVLPGVANGVYNHPIHRQKQDNGYGEHDDHCSQNAYDANDLLETAQHAH